MAEAGRPYELQPASFPRDEINSPSHNREHAAGPSSTSSVQPNIAAVTTARPPTAPSRRGRPEGKPPRPMNAWLIFRNAQLKLLKEEDPEGPRKSQGEMSKIIAERWRNVDRETRQEYETMAKERKEEFRQAYPDYRYGPHKPKDKTAKARVGLPDPPTLKRSLPKPTLRLGGNEPIPQPDSRGTTDCPTMTRTVRVVSAPDPASFRSTSPRASVSLPTPVSARSRWSHEQHLRLSPPSAHHAERDPSHDAANPSPYSSALPASAPAASSSFQSSLASLGASISSLAQPALQYQLAEEDRYQRRVSIPDYRQFRDPDPQYRDQHGRGVAVPPYPLEPGPQPEHEPSYHGWQPRQSFRTSYYAMSADPPPPAHDYPGEHQRDPSPLSRSLMSSSYARGPDAYTHLRHVPADGQHMYNPPESQALPQLHLQPPMLPDLRRFDGRLEERPIAQSYEAGDGPPRW